MLNKKHRNSLEELGIPMNETEKIWFENYFKKRDAWLASLSAIDRAYFKRMDEYAKWQADMDEQRAAER
jgi:hypothetical protein